MVLGNSAYTTTEYSDRDMLNFLMDSGIINIGDVKKAMTNQKKKEILAAHPYKIYQGKDLRWYTYIQDDTKTSKRKKLVKATEEQLHKALCEYYKMQDEAARLASMTLCDLYPEWREYKALKSADTYMQRIETDWKKYYLQADIGVDIVHVPIRKLDKLTLDKWAHGMIKSFQLSKNQFYNMAVIVRQTLSYAVELGIIETNPMDQVKIDGKRLFRKVKKKPDATQVYFRDELDELKTMAWEDFYNRTKVYQLAPLAVLFSFNTGLRISELCVLRYEDIVDANHIQVQRMLRRDTKEIVDHPKGTYGERTVILTKEAQKIIECAKQRQNELNVDSTGYIFSINDEPLSYHSVADLYRKYCKKMDIVRKSSHKARKTYISTLVDGNININTIREMVGHADERTTYKNYCFDRSTETEKIDKIEMALA